MVYPGDEVRINDILATIKHNQPESGKCEQNVLINAQKNYNAYKTLYKKNMRFDPLALTYGEYIILTTPVISI